MGKSNVEIYLRIRPPSTDPQYSTIDVSNSIVEFNLPKDESGYINNQRVHYDFKFNGILSNYSIF